MTPTQQTQHEEIFSILAKDYIKEKRRRRRWGVFFKSAFLIIFLVIVATEYFSQETERPSADTPHAALIDIRGPIFDNSKAKADNIIKSLRQAFKDKGTKGIILRINSPGGSPVQADYIYQEIKRLRQQYPETKIYSVCTDLCASAAYYIAAASDEIYANPASIVGSIGVVFDGFGFVDTLHKLGVERRLVTAGKNKGFLDPFSPSSPEDVEHLRTMLSSVHEQFIERVKEGRGEHLAKNSQLFSGSIWVGTQAKYLGLIDHFGSAGSIARDVIKTKHIIDYTVKESYFSQLAKQFGSELSSVVMNELSGNKLRLT